MPGLTLTQYLLDVTDDAGRTAGYAQVLSAVAVATKVTAALVSRGSLILDTAATADPPEPREERA